MKYLILLMRCLGPTTFIYCCILYNGRDYFAYHNLYKRKDKERVTTNRQFDVATVEDYSAGTPQAGRN